MVEFAVGAGDGATGQTEVGSELAHGWQSISRRQDPGFDEAGQLRSKLFVGGDRGGQIDTQTRPRLLWAQ